MVPEQILELFVLYSPVIVMVGCLNLSFVFQNFKGFIYLLAVFIVCVLREYMLMLYYKFIVPMSIPTRCSSVKYSNYDNSGFSTFLLSYTLLYVSFPMIMNKEVNYAIFAGLVFYLGLDTGYRYTIGCIPNIMGSVTNFIFGIIAGLITMAIMYAGNLQNNLFFNETSSSKNICSMKKKQTFKCSVYKNGELIGSA